MIQARLTISDRANHVLNIVKAKYNLKDKSAALDKLVAEYEEKILEPPLKPEFIRSVLETEKEPLIGPFKNMKEFEAYLDSLPEEGE
jgi:hypothetical protein